MDDDLMPNDGTFYHLTEPEEQKQEESEERAKAIQGMALLEELIERLNTRITFYDSLNSIAPDVKDTPEQHLRACIAGQMTKQNLIQEKEYMEGLRDKYKV
jgi:hypothetical protein